MKLELIALGKEDPAWQPLVEDYASRINHYVPFSITLITPPRMGGKGSEMVLKEKEAALILRHLGKDDRQKPSPQGKHDLQKLALTGREDPLILLDERGKALTSPRFADLVNQQLISGRKRLLFLIGGAFGVHDVIRQRATYTLSLSAMTYPHQLARLVFTEQLYRAMTILRNESYHH